MIEISKTNTLSKHSSGPHFTLDHDGALREDKDGIEHIELSLDSVVNYLDADPGDPMRIEAAALLCNNSGLVFNHGRFSKGERGLSLLFSTHDGREKEGTGGLRTDSRGERFVSLHTQSVALILGHKRDFPGRDKSYQEIEGHILAMCKQMGLVPNMARIDAEFCRTCGSKQQ